MGNDDKRWLLIQNALIEKQIEESFALFRSNGIEPILIKGWAAVRFYPEDKKRSPGDVDLAVAPDDYEKALEIQREAGGKLPIDLHRGLRHLDTMPYADIFARSEIVKLGSTDVRLLCDEDHLRVLCVHWLNDGGAYKEKLKDIHYAVENRRADFDWEKCLSIVDSRRRRWIACAILLAHKYLGTRIDDTPLAMEPELPRWLIRTVEKEWANDVRLQPLHLFFRHPKGVWKQIKKRIPPNALQATIDMEGHFDRHPRIFYQVGDVLFRIGLSFKRIIAARKPDR